MSDDENNSDHKSKDDEIFDYDDDDDNEEEVEENGEKKMKEIYCDICERSYKINYYYYHRKHSKRHLKKLKGKNNLLDVGDNNNEIRNYKVFLEDLKERIDDILKNNI